MTTQDIRIQTAATATPLASSAAPAAAAAPAAPKDTTTFGGTQAPEQLMPKSFAKTGAAEPGKPDYVPGQVLVKFKPGASASAVSAFADEFGLTTLRHFDVPAEIAEKFGGELYQFKLQGGETVNEALKRLVGQPGVAYAEPNYKIQLDTIRNDEPTDPPTEPTPPPTEPTEPPAQTLPNDLDGRLWGIQNTGQDGGRAGADIGAVAAWDKTTGKKASEGGPLIAVIDTGIDYNHQDLAGNAWVNPGEIPGDGIDNDGNGIIDDVHGANIITKSGDPMDDNDHGSHTSGTIGGVGNNGVGVVGVNWNASIAGVKFLDGGGGGTYADAVDAVLYATRIGARVTSNSWGGGGFSQALQDAFAASPAIHICAAGNEGSDLDAGAKSYPASFDLPNIVSVAAHDRNDQLADFSNYGATQVDIAAPGVDVLSTTPNNGYQSFSGTSMATPHVSGVVGLMLSDNPDLTNEQIKARLINTSIKGEAYEGKMIGGGRVNAANTMETDDVPPADPQGFQVSERGATGMTLAWQATGDDGLEGNAAAYEVRYSDQPITPENWGAAVRASGAPSPQSPGSEESFRVALSPDDTEKEYFFGLKASDNMGNQSGLVTTSGTTLAAAVPFKDDMEADTDNWTADGTWAKVEVEGRGKVYTDSPDGGYADNADTSLTSKPLDLTQVGHPRLLFKAKLDTEKRYDFLHVELTNDGGQTWTELAKYDGVEDWNEKALDLSSYEGQTVQVRFRLTGDSSISGDGVYIDDVKVAGDPK